MELSHPWRFHDPNIGEIKAPPDCVWYDAMHEHWVAFYEADRDQGLYIFQRFSIPAPISVPFLVQGPPMTILLPPNQRNQRPLLVKLSLDHKFLAIQFSVNQVRVVPLGESKHWTIDLTIDLGPQSSKPMALPTLPLGHRLKVIKAKSSILPGGVYWSDHGGTSQDLILCTDKGVLIYKISNKKGMSSTHSFHHPSEKCWMEPRTRTILVSSKARQGYVMRTYILQGAEVKKSAFPRLEVLPPDRPAVFTLSSDLVELVYLNRKAYCVHMDIGHIRLRQLIQNEGPVDVCYVKIEGFQPNGDMFVSVIESLLNIHFRNSKTTILIDIQDIEHPIQINGAVSLKELDVYSDELVMSAPHYMQGKETVHTLTLNLDRVLMDWTENKLIIPFLLRRIQSVSAHTFVLNQMVRTLRQPSEKRERREWLESTAAAYKRNHIVWHRDCHESIELMSATALLPRDPQFKGMKDRHMNSVSMAGLVDWNKVLPQSTIVEKVLLPEAKQAINTKSDQHLTNVLDFAIDLTGAFSRHDIEPAPALCCLLAALLWRLGYSKELVVFLKSIVSQPVSRSETKPSYFDEGCFAEMVLAVVCEILPGCGANNEMKRSLSQREDFIRKDIRNILIASMPRQLAAKYLLESGRLLDAISVCTEIANNDDNYQLDCDEFLGSIHKPTTNSTILKAEDFFSVALKYAESECTDIASRCRLFFNLHHFLLLWDPDSVTVESLHVAPNSRSNNEAETMGIVDLKALKRRMSQTMPVLSSLQIFDERDITEIQEVVFNCEKNTQSALALRFPIFPDHLFGGPESEVCQKVRALFGYRN